MPWEIIRRPDLRRIRSSLDAIYGDRIARLVLFGSRARGGAHTGSDYDEARPFRAGSYRDRTLLMHEPRRDGIDL